VFLDEGFGSIGSHGRSTEGKDAIVQEIVAARSRWRLAAGRVCPPRPPSTNVLTISVTRARLRLGRSLRRLTVLDVVAPGLLECAARPATEHGGGKPFRFREPMFCSVFRRGHANRRDGIQPSLGPWLAYVGGSVRANWLQVRNQAIGSRSGFRGVFGGYASFFGGDAS
jgi:hypothetical protein